MSVLWLSRLIGLVVVASALIPFIRHGAWIIRLWDFPRAQTLFLGGVAAVGFAACTWRAGLRTDLLVSLGLVIAAMLVQGWFILRYTPLWPARVPKTSESDLRLLVMNLDKRNTMHEAVAAEIERVDPDLLLLLEIGDEWHNALGGVRTRFDHHLEVVRGEGLGIALWSRFPLEDERIDHIVSERRASLWTTVQCPDTPPIYFAGLHPTPPGLEVQHGSGRYDSRIRDAELIKVAERIASSDHTPWIVAGDFNDVAWSHTTRLFQRISRMLDPRIGRGMYNTYHAQYPLLRYPLDHVFLSTGLAVHRMRIIKTPGSDHFGVLIEVEFDRSHQPEPPKPDSGDREEAAEMTEEGHESAEKHNEHSG